MKMIRNSKFIIGTVASLMYLRARREVVQLSANQIANGALLNVLYHLSIGTRIADLKANDQTNFSVQGLSNLFNTLAARHVRSDRFLTVNVFTRRDSSFHKLRVCIRRR